MRLAKHPSGCLSNAPFGQRRVGAAVTQRQLAGTEKVGNPNGDKRDAAVPFVPSIVQRTAQQAQERWGRCGLHACEDKGEEDKVAPGRGLHFPVRETQASLQQHPVARLARSAMQIMSTCCISCGKTCLCDNQARTTKVQSCQFVPQRLSTLASLSQFWHLSQARMIQMNWWPFMES